MAPHTAQTYDGSRAWGSARRACCRHVPGQWLPREADDVRFSIGRSWTFLPRLMLPNLRTNDLLLPRVRQLAGGFVSRPFYSRRACNSPRQLERRATLGIFARCRNSSQLRHVLQDLTYAAESHQLNSFGRGCFDKQRTTAGGQRIGKIPQKRRGRNERRALD